MIDENIELYVSMYQVDSVL